MTERRLTAEQREALELLASDPQGATEELLVLLLGFDSDMIAGLVSNGLAMARRENSLTVSMRADLWTVRRTVSRSCCDRWKGK